MLWINVSINININIFSDFFKYYSILYKLAKSPGELIENFDSLKLKVEYLQNLVNIKQNDIDGLKSAFTLNVEYYNGLVEKQKKILDHLKNNSVNFYGIGNDKLRT